MIQFNPEIETSIEFIKSQINFDSPNKRLLFFIPESAGDIFLSTALLPSLNETYPEFDIYYACKRIYFDILKGNPNIDYIMEECFITGDCLLMEGVGTWPGLFDICIYGSVLTQLFSQYCHNGIDRIALNLRK